MSEGEYVQGTMDIDAQRKSFDLFYALTKWGTIFCVTAVVLLAVMRTNAPDCSKADQAAANLNECGKIDNGAEGAAAE